MNSINPRINFSTSPVGLFRSFLVNRSLIWQMTKREVAGRYRGSILGLAWSFVNPLIMLAVYTFVFSVVFKARWNVGVEGKAGFALALFIGLIVHGILADCMSRAPSLILNNVNFVKKVVFPIEILPWVVMGATLFHSCISLSVWSLFFIVVNHTFHWTAVFLPIIFLPLILFTMGISWFLASIGVFIRDIGQFVSVITMILLFMAPIFYPVSLLPEPYRQVLYLNPLTFFIEQARQVLIIGNLPNLTGLSISLVLYSIVSWLGYYWFQKTKRGFADVL